MGQTDRKIIKKYALPFAIAFLQWGIWQIFGVGKRFLSFQPEDPYVWVQKGCFLCFLCLIWNFLFFFVRKVISGDNTAKRALQVFSVYFSILILMLVLLWPGCWYWDDIGVLASARNYDVLPWQHVLSSFFQTLFLQLVPTPGGVILVQLFTGAVIVSYAISEFEASFLGGSLLIKWWLPDTLIKLIPFLLPPVVLYQYSGFRMGLYIFIEIFVLAFITGISVRERNTGVIWLILFAFAVAVLSTWRTEGFLYAPVMILLISLQKKETLSASKKILTAGVILLGIFMISSFQKDRAGDSNYSVVTILRPLCEVVRAADPVEDKELLQDIDAVVSTGMMLDNPEVNGEDLLWKYDLQIDGYTDEEYSAFMKAFAGLCMRHPKAVIKERVKVFIDTSAIHGRTNPTNVVGAYYLFDPEEQNDNQKEFTEWDAPLNRPVSSGLRQRFLLFLGCLNEDFSELITYRLVWDIIVPILVIIAVWVYLLIKKKGMLFTALAAVALRIPVLFLTAPATWTMYYLSFYLIGYVLLAAVLVMKANNKDL